MKTINESNWVNILFKSTYFYFMHLVINKLGMKINIILEMAIANIFLQQKIISGPYWPKMFFLSFFKNVMVWGSG